MISFETIILINKKDLEVKALKKRVRDSGLYIKSGAMEVLTNPDVFTLNTLDLIVLVLVDNVLIGWASVISGFSEKHHSKDRAFPTYPHVGAYIDPKHRGQGLARQALDILLDIFKKNDFKKEYSFKTFGYSNSGKIFKPSLNRLRLRANKVDALPVSEIKIEFD